MHCQEYTELKRGFSSEYKVIDLYSANLNCSLISGSLSPRHGASSGCGWRNGFQMWRVAANTLNKQSRTANKGWTSSFGVGLGANNTSP
jgi:hypothetical protein